LSTAQSVGYFHEYPELQKILASGSRSHQWKYTNRLVLRCSHAAKRVCTKMVDVVCNAIGTRGCAVGTAAAGVTKGRFFRSAAKTRLHRGERVTPEEVQQAMRSMGGLG